MDYAVIAGTVFREPGFALPQAEVVLAQTEAKEGAKKAKRQKTAVNFRGEFAFRVPPGPAEYLLTFKAKGFETIEKKVSIVSVERIDQFVTLKPVGKKE